MKVKLKKGEVLEIEYDCEKCGKTVGFILKSLCCECRKPSEKQTVIE